MPLPLFPTTTFDYTQITREGLLERAYKLYNQVNPSHEDFSANYPENLLLEGAVMLIDMIRIVMEQRARQNYWATVTERRAAMRLGRLSSFELREATPSTATGTFTAVDAGTIAKEIDIPLGTRARTQDPSAPQDYRTTALAVKPAGTASVDVAMEAAREQVDTFASTGEANQEYILSTSPYIKNTDGSHTMAITDGIGAFELVRSFVGLKGDGSTITANDRVAVLLVDDQGQPVVRFGNGICGAVPQGTITCTYKTGGGSTSAVEANAKWIIQDTLVDEFGEPVFLKLTNAAEGVAGTDAMTVEEAKVLGPQSMRTQSRCVNEADFEHAALTVAGVCRAALITSNRMTGMGENQAVLRVVGLGEELASGRHAPADPAGLASQVAAIEGLLEEGGTYEAMMSLEWSVAAAQLYAVNVSVWIMVASTHTAAEARTAVVDALADFFAPVLADHTPNTEMGFGFEFQDADGDITYLLDWSQVLKTVLAAPGVRGIPYTDDALLLNEARASVTVPAGEFPKLGTVRVYNYDTGNEITE